MIRGRPPTQDWDLDQAALEIECGGFCRTRFAAGKRSTVLISAAHSMKLTEICIAMHLVAQTNRRCCERC